MSTSSTVRPTGRAAFPAQAIETSIRGFLAHEGEMRAALHGGSPGGIGPQPTLDSLVIVELLVELEGHVPFELPESLVRAGGYDSVDDVVQHLVPKIRRLWEEHNKENSDAR